ncbi:MAG: hypothetical protein ACU843_03000 [Gammaproteobacteria bacterium]
MTKSTATYWNVLASEAQQRWSPVKGLEGMVEELTLSIDGESGEYTKLTRFLLNRSFAARRAAYSDLAGRQGPEGSGPFQQGITVLELVREERRRLRRVVLKLRCA